MLSDSLNSRIPLIHLNGQNILKIFNYIKVLKYEQTEIHILLFKKKLYVQGIRLNIEYFNEDELYIRGHIHAILFEDN